MEYSCGEGVGRTRQRRFVIHDHVLVLTLVLRTMFRFLVTRLLAVNWRI